MRTLSFTKLFFVAFLLVVATVKVVGSTDNKLSNYGENTKLTKVMTENSIKGGA